MKKTKHKIWLFILVIFSSFVIYHLSLLRYGIGQLTGQLSIIYNAVPVSEVLNSPNTNDSIRSKLILAEEIRRFAMDSLGLADSKNYTTFYNQNNQPIMWVVTGCLPYELTAKEWWFPVLGNVSYKGYFEEQKAIIEEQRIRTEGYDTDIYNPSAWSTLGFFKDPILSNMLKRGPGRLSELIIHELTHATIYLNSSVTFNENFATFVGERGAELFLESRYGKESEEMKKYVGALRDEEIYSSYMMQSANTLDSLYKSFTPEMDVTQKAKLKYQTIAAIMSEIRKLPLSYPERYTFDFKKTPLPNNTEFMAFLRYRKSQDVFREVYEKKYNSNLKIFVADIVRRSDEGEDLPFDIKIK